MAPRFRIGWTAEAIAPLLAKANDRRTTRLLSLDAVEECAEEAASSELGIAWRTGGAAPDARGLTTLCLCVRRDAAVTIGIAAAHGAARPDVAFGDLKKWDAYSEAANFASAQAWAGRKKDDRVSLPLVEIDLARSTPESLLAQILERPEDDQLREVYADALSDAGDPRGEFIQIQLALARTEDERLRAREEELLALHGAQWAGGLAAPVFERGFLEGASISVDEVWNPVFEREPVRSITLERVGSRFDIERFITVPWLPRLRSLGLSSNRASIAEQGTLGRRWSTILDARGLHNLEALDFDQQRIGAQGVGALLERGPAAFPNLKRLRFTSDEIGSPDSLFGSRWVGQLDALALESVGLRGESLNVLSHGPAMRLRTLSLFANPLGNLGAAFVLGSTRLPMLRSLRLGRCGIGAASIVETLESSSLREQLDRLDLRDNPLGEATIERIRVRLGARLFGS